MKNDRRDFIKMSGIAGLGIAGGIMNGYASESIKYDDLNLKVLNKHNIFTTGIKIFFRGGFVETSQIRCSCFWRRNEPSKYY